MRTRTIIIVIIIVILAVWVYLANRMTPGENSTSSIDVNSSSNNPNNTTPNSTTSQSTETTNPASELFSTSPLAKNAYLISGSTYDANTKKALSGFSVTKTAMPDGGTQITLNAENAEYKTQTYTVEPGEKLYFIEMNLSDDNGNTDKTTVDDQAVLVDANGYIITQGNK